MMPTITYKPEYCYHLAEEYSVVCPVKATPPLSTPFISLNENGTLIVRRGYAWDGPHHVLAHGTGMRAVLVKDALYQLMRLGLLDETTHRSAVDAFCATLRVEDGMGTLRARFHAAWDMVNRQTRLAPVQAKHVRTAPWRT